MSDLTPAMRREINRRVASELAGKMNNEDRVFTPFPVPVQPTDTPLVQWNQEDYLCTGCGGSVPHGVWLHETVEDGMVVGLLARVGADGPVVHRCGTAGE